MPKEQRQRPELHASSVKLLKRQPAVQEKAVGVSDVSTHGIPILHALSAPQGSASSRPISKKDKQQIKREALLQRLASGLSPYSKSHARRLKKKAREQIAGGLSDMQAAIVELVKDESTMTNREPPDTTSTTESAEIKPNSNSAKIGEGKCIPLTAKQRKRALQLEQKRHPAILSDPDFSSNPFQTIRTHAENTLIKR
ncbi:hypothetical protein APHAL10511_006292 [Amanita phalloides]|nr:hypothetical protein APHAL10511_006292 [Amanita phalloides]